jgi:hypothetical protein
LNTPIRLALGSGKACRCSHASSKKTEMDASSKKTEMDGDEDEDEDEDDDDMTDGQGG